MDDRFDVKQFRSALGRFATGVTVITARDSGGAPVGVTANSFNSVSLNPPMVLWSLARSSASLAAFQQAERFAVHILSAAQEAISDRFASRGIDKFEGLALAAEQVPLLQDCSARFLCRTVSQYDGGDHVIFVGEVLDFEACEKPPLLFHGGKYAETRPRWQGAFDGIDPGEARVGAHSLTYLIAQAHAQLVRPLHGWLEEYDLQQPRYLILSVVSHSDGPSCAQVIERVRLGGYPVDPETLPRLLAQGLVREASGRLTLTDAGRKIYIAVLTRLKAFEDHLATCFSGGELADARIFLERLIARTSSDVPRLLD